MIRLFQFAIIKLMKRKGFATIIILPVIAFFLVAGGIWYWGSHQQPSTRSADENSATSAIGINPPTTTSGYEEQTPASLSPEESSGQPPLDVHFDVEMPYGQPFSISFGDSSSSGPLTLEPSPGGPAAGSDIAGHIYTQDGTYTAKLMDVSGKTLATAPITVSGPTTFGTIDPTSLNSTNGTPTISGTANVNSVFMEIQYIVAWNDDYTLGGDVYETSIPVINGHWSVSDPTKIDNGNYVVNVSSNQAHSLATGMLTVTGSMQPGPLIVYPTSSLAYLGLTFIVSEPVGQYTINFGDGSSTRIQTTRLQCPAGNENCGTPAGIIYHTYINDGSYTATLLSASGTTLGTLTIPITGSACGKSMDGGKTWQPVPCGTPPPYPL